MVFTETKLKGAFIIDPAIIEDARGFFARVWCQREFADNGLCSDLVQSNISFNRLAGTLRGMHYQAPPCEEDKLVRCTQGAVYDVIIDLRPASETFKQWVGVQLSAVNHRMIYVPKGFAHGYQTLSDNCEVFYHVSGFYSPEHERGVRWNDPALGIQWLKEVRVISERDRQHPDFDL